MGLGEALSKHLISLLQKYNWPIDIILAVPLSSERLKTRGYNQSALLALPVSLYCKIPFKSKAIWRTRDTMSQVGLSPSERRLNVAGAFQADPDVLNNKTVLIIDDVTTTGATINACAKALSDAGAEFVYGLTLASAVSNPDFVHHLPKLISMSE